MKKLLYTLLAVSLVFTACEKEDEEPENTNNNGNNTNNTIADVVGVWNLIGYYDALGNLDSFNSTASENCALQGSITLQSDGNGIIAFYYLQDEVSGPCISENYLITFNYINSTTLEFIMASSCGNPVVTLPNPTQLKIPMCNADDSSFDGSYVLYEL